MKRALSGIVWKGDIYVAEGPTHDMVKPHKQEVADLVSESLRRLEKVGEIS